MTTKVRTTIGTTEDEISPALRRHQTMTIVNYGPSPCFIGETGVTVTSGVEVAASAHFPFELKGPKAAIFAICGSGTAMLSIAKS